MKIVERIEALSSWGSAIEALLDERLNKPGEGVLDPYFRKAGGKNPWFTEQYCELALRSVSSWLNRKDLSDWLAHYPTLQDAGEQKNVAIVMAGNIPLVGFHDLLCVLICGHKALIRCSSDDDVLLPFLTSVLTGVEPRFASQIEYITQVKDPDMVIATGSNNTARYFEHYFGKYQHLIRRNRNSIAVLSGNESEQELKELGLDIFLYFGLGCRNVSKLYVPQDYVFDPFFRAIESFGAALMQHNKYMNNFDYHQAVFLLNSEKYLTNNFLIVREHDAQATPVSVLHYARYTDLAEVEKELSLRADEIQCRVGVNGLPFGKSQQPGLMDYADGVDVLKWMLG